MAIKEQMCVFKQVSHMIHERKDAPAWFRCPECGRRLKPKLIDCHYGIPGAEECWHWNIPPHKKKGWWKLGKRKKTSRDV